MKWSLVGVAVGVLVSAPVTVYAQNAPQQPPCRASEHRQFDFWIGEWDVHTPDGNQAGSNIISAEFNGCVLHERWTSARGGGGSSFNIYDGATGKWHQTWVDGIGTLLQLDGGLHDGKMVLEGDRAGRDGQTVRHRISWEPLADGRVRQLWTTSTDGGATWRQVFDGYYTKRTP